MKTLITILIILSASITSMAQNSIDELFESYKSVGNSKFTSAVERDPNTHEVVKVVKMIESDVIVKMIESDVISVKSFKKAFEQEAIKATSANKNVTDNNISHVLVFESDKQIRIYSLKYDNRPGFSWINASIIIKYIKK